MSEPYYSDESVQLYLGDCLQIDAWLEADVLVTDPPYGRNWSARAMMGQRRPGGSRRTSPAHDGIANDKDTRVRDAALEAWSGRAVVFGDLMLKPPDGTRQVLIYQKPNDAGIRGTTAGFRRDTEAVYLIGPWVSGIAGATSVIRTTARQVGSPVGIAALSGHPHAKPLDVMTRLLELSDGIIADPFAGSGSTLAAAKQLGRKAIGVELEERYCEVIARRLAQGVLPLGGESA